MSQFQNFQNAISPLKYTVWSGDSCILISQIPSTKVMGLEIQLGSFGVTGGQEVSFTNNAISPTNYMVQSWNSCIFFSQIPSTKVMSLEIQPGSFGVTGVKRSFSPKTLFLLQITWYGRGTHAYSSARYLLQKLWVQKFTRGHLGSQGSKVHFHQKCCFSFRLHGMVMGLTHINQLGTHYKLYMSRNSHRVIWGHGVKDSFLPKLLFLLQFTQHNNETQAYSSI